MEKIKIWVSLWQPTGTHLDRQRTVFLVQVMVSWQQVSPAPRVLTDTLYLGQSCKWVNFAPRNQTLQSYTPFPRFINSSLILALSVHIDLWQSNCVCIFSTLQLLSLINAGDSTFCGLKWSISKARIKRIQLLCQEMKQISPYVHFDKHWLIISQCTNIEISKLLVWSRLSWNVGSSIKQIHSTATSGSNKPK